MMNVGRKAILFSIASCLFSVSASNHASEFIVGHAIGSHGVGAYVSGTTDWSFRSDKDAIQWRAIVGGASFDADDIEIDDIEYDGDIDSLGGQVGLDWYPFASSQIFFSGGAAYFDREYDLRTQRNQNYDVGNQQVLASDNTHLNTDIDHSSFAPYLSVGWGNRHRGKKGFSFFAELGVMFPVSDSDVDVSVSGNQGLISSEDLNKYKRDLEDEINGPQLNASVGFGYRF